MTSRHLLRLTEVVESFVRYQEYQNFVFAPKLQRPVQPFPLNALTIAGGRVTLTELMAFGCPWLGSVRVTVQGGDAHVVGDRVPCVLADVAVDPIP